MWIMIIKHKKACKMLGGEDFYSDEDEGEIMSEKKKSSQTHFGSLQFEFVNIQFNL